ncbi:hypothetical protein J3R30DRAFT_3710073 [Lentinula aciculospora]|uniref:rRNA-processing protein EFG1 n=1 Tax=Lentinula aciculospora TaxID=153920 RepID=A0A9W9DJ13_9AGAR|nr:hypothetical protein J3R30DRAFT_3710073 [Lentinula aciculospora]
MAPLRTEKSTTRTVSSSHPVAGPSKQRKKRPTSYSEPSVLPGVQKIKAIIRQTKRLLAKDKLAADVRVTSERKLKSLEADLAKAELSRKERALSTRYHKVKFFERQKVVRKINQTKRKLSEADLANRQTLDSDLYERRVELNYINHYPKTKKYISLFPPVVRNNLQTTNSPSIEPEQERDEVKRWIREQMTAGTLPAEPEDIQRSQYSSNQMEWDKKVKKNVKAKEGSYEEIEDDRDDFFQDDEGED